MAIYETFSKRLKRLGQSGQPDVYQYADLPKAFRIQVVHIWRDVMPPDDEGIICERDWENIHNVMARELGLWKLDSPSKGDFNQCASFLVKAKIDDALDLIELTFRWIDQEIRQRPVGSTVDHAIIELNHRFREHAIGYQFESGELIRVDSQFVHAEVAKPALTLLHEAGFKGAQEEFLKAHEHYRHGRTKEAIAEALKAFESTMKAICDGRKWPYPATATAKTLIDILFDKELIPSSMQSHFTAFRSTLETGLPTVRNKTSGHGQGAQPVTIPDYIAAYALHLAATNILMLVQAHKA
jgi:Domain of unknown function (DUF7014)/AbiJ N-terminal domain 4